MDVKVAVLIFVIDILFMFFGYLIGFGKGKLRGMEELISIIKVYDTDGFIIQSLGTLLNNAGKMTEEEKAKVFRDYVERHLNGKNWH